MTQVQMVLGSKSFLRRYYNEYDTPRVLLKSLTKGQNFALVDLAGTMPFAAPLRYTVEAQANPVPSRGVFQFMYFQLTAHDAPLLADKAKRLIDNAAQLRGLQSMALWHTQSDIIEYVLVSVWETQLDAFASRRTPLTQPVLAYREIASRDGGFFERLYQAFDPNAKDDADDEADPPAQPSLGDLFKSDQ